MAKNIEKNSLKKIRESLMMSKAELSRIENGMSCRIKTQRKILLALGLKLSDKAKVFH